MCKERADKQECGTHSTEGVVFNHNRIAISSVTSRETFSGSAAQTDFASQIQY